MTASNQFLLALQAYQEILTEEKPDQDSSTLIEPARRQSAIIPVAGPLPGGLLQIGIADDGLPLVLDLLDAGPGSIMVTGDEGAGKTACLKSIARSLDAQPEPGDVQFAVLTNFPEEWRSEECLPASLGVWPAFHPAAVEFLDQLVDWTKALATSRQSLILLIDDLDLMTALNAKSRHDLRWLLRNGPANHLWPIVSMSARHLEDNMAWTIHFHTFILGQTTRTQNIPVLSTNPGFDPAELEPGSQFMIRMPDCWLRFRISTT